MKKSRPPTCRQALAKLLQALHIFHHGSASLIPAQLNIAMFDGYSALGSMQTERAKKAQKVPTPPKK